MKTQLLKQTISVVAVASTVWATSAVAGTKGNRNTGCCLDFAPFSGVKVQAFKGCTDNNTPFTVTLGSASPMPIPAANYTFWCIDDNDIDIGVPFTYKNATLYSSCDPNLTAEPGLRQPTSGSYANIAKINYILNNPDNIPATYVDIQNAIWHYAGGPPGPNFGSCFNYSAGFPTAAYLALIAGADASPHYVVPCGGLVAVIIAIPDSSFGKGVEPIQNIVIPVPCNCPPPQHNCTYTIGYYKNHPNALTPLPIFLGAQGGPKTLVVDSEQVGVDVLSQKVYCSPSDGITKLYAQLLAAKLNISNGADASAVAGVITDADAFLASHDCTDWNSLSAADQFKVLLWQTALDSYNNGNIGPGHCGD